MRSAVSEPILVPVDFSAHSRAALDWAIDLAERLDVSVLVLHVIHDPEDAPGYYVKPDDDATWSAESAAREMLEDFVADSGRGTAAKPSIALELVSGVPVRRILEVAGRVGARQIVMGSHGRTGLGQVLLGSKAQSVVQRAPMPVTIVKAPRETES